MFFKLLGVEYWNLLYFHICLSLLDQKNNFLCISPTKITYQCVCFQQKWSVVTTGFYYQKKGWAIVFWLAALNPGEVTLLLLIGASIREPIGGPLVCWSALKCLQQYVFIFNIYIINFFFVFFNCEHIFLRCDVMVIVSVLIAKIN